MRSSKNSTEPTQPTDPPPTALAPAITPLRQTILWLLEGNSTEDVGQAIAAAFPKENAKKLIAAAGEHFALVAGSDQNVIRGWCLDAIRELYRRMVAIGDYSGALKAIKELTQLGSKCSRP